MSQASAEFSIDAVHCEIACGTGKEQMFHKAFPVVQLLQSTEALLASLGPDLFRDCRPSRVVVVLGGVVSRPLEAYELLFQQHARSPDGPPGEMVSHHRLEVICPKMGVMRSCNLLRCLSLRSQEQSLWQLSTNLFWHAPHIAAVLTFREPQGSGDSHQAGTAGRGGLHHPRGQGFVK